MSLTRELLKRVLPRRWVASVRLAKSIGPRLDALEKQSLLLNAYIAREAYPHLMPVTPDAAAFNRHEIKVYSQNGEDGLILNLFSTIGVRNRYFVEFGCGNGSECNTANLSVNFGWRGLLLDADDARIAQARAFYERMLGPRAGNVRIANTRVTAENINDTLRRQVPEREIDLLSIDIDGNDYWVWRAIEAVEPRAVVIEYNSVFGPERALTVKYDPEFRRWAKHPSGLYFGASLAALVKLGRAKGYRLIGCDRQGVNAFFIPDHVDGFPEVPPETAYLPNNDRVLGLVTPDRFREIEHLPFVEV
ncbi:MAG: hypothetical protein KA184_07925 [Candidatus Hydrogenedentes bacterium]|nr:hypothetical protein [Candidatus Hydrogenedentota bacterium]